MIIQPAKPLLTVDSLEAELKSLLAPLQKQLEESKYPKHQEQIQQRIGLIPQLHQAAIKRAKAKWCLYERKLKEFNKQVAARQAAIKATDKQELLRAYVKPGGDPANFEADLPAIEKAIIQQRVVDSVLRLQKPSASITL
jgi:hypothetical protein